MKQSARIAFFFAVALVAALPVQAEVGPSYFFLETRDGTDRTISSVSFMTPYRAGPESLSFFDVRLREDARETVETNFGFGHRFTSRYNTVVGLYGFADRLETQHDNVFYQATGGLEYMTDQETLRLNGYFPEQGSESFGPTIPADLEVVGNRLYLRNQRAQETALPGFDIEYEHHLQLQDSVRLNTGLGYFHFDDDHVEELSGPRIRTEAVVKTGWFDSTLAVGGEYHDDGQSGDQYLGTARLRIPFGGTESDAPTRDAYDRRMAQRIRRDIDIKTGGHVKDRSEPAVNPETDEPYGEVVFAEAGADQSDGTRDNPTSISDAISRVGEGGLLFVKGNKTINTDGIVLDSHSTLSGGVVSRDAVGPNGKTVTFTVGERDGSTITINGDGSDVVTLKEGATNIKVSDVSINGTGGSGSAITGSENSDVTIRDVTAEKTGEHAIHLTGTDSSRVENVTVDNVTVRETLRDGVQVENGRNITVKNSTFENMTGEDTNNTFADAGKQPVFFEDVQGGLIEGIETTETSGGIVVRDFSNDITIRDVTIGQYTGAVAYGSHGLELNNINDADVDNITIKEGNRRHGVRVVNHRGDITVTNMAIDAASNAPKFSGRAAEALRVSTFSLSDSTDLGSITFDGLDIDKSNKTALTINNYTASATNSEDVTIKNANVTKAGNETDGEVFFIGSNVEGITVKDSTFIREKGAGSGSGFDIQGVSTKAVFDNVDVVNSFVNFENTIENGTFDQFTVDLTDPGPNAPSNAAVFGGITNSMTMDNVSGTINVDLQGGSSIGECSVDQGNSSFANTSLSINETAITDC